MKCFSVKENLVVTRLNKGNLDKLYDFDKGEPKILDIKAVCNQIIHSYIFAPNFGEDGKLDGIVFCSDFTRNKEVYQMDMTEIRQVLNSVGSDYPKKGKFIFDNDKKDYIIDLT